MKLYKYHTVVTVSPAYNRVYVQKVQAQKDFERGLNFLDSNNQLMSIRDCKVSTLVKIKYGKKLQKTAMCMVELQKHADDPIQVTGDDITQILQFRAKI